MWLHLYCTDIFAVVHTSSMKLTGTWFMVLSAKQLHLKKQLLSDQLILSVYRKWGYVSMKVGTKELEQDECIVKS